MTAAGDGPDAVRLVMESGGLDQEGEPIIRRRTIAGVVVASLAVSLSVGLMTLGPVQQPKAAQPERGFSIVSLQPDVAQSLRAQGKQISYPSPSTANKGKKFNPGGETITQLVTAPQAERARPLRATSPTPPPGGPPRGWTSGRTSTTMLFGTVYDPPEYAAFPGHPTDRTLYNYYKEVSYGAVDIATLNMPEHHGLATVGPPVRLLLPRPTAFTTTASAPTRRTSRDWWSTPSGRPMPPSTSATTPWTA